MKQPNRDWILHTFLAIITVIVCARGVTAQVSPVPDGAEVETIATDFQFTEGPHWHRDGFLIFSDIPASTIYRWSPDDGSVDVFRRPSGRSNGITVDNAGHLILAQHDGRVSLIEEDGQETPLAPEYQGKRLNSPNDVVVKSDGTVYFTDPPYGVSEEAKELDVHGVYRVSGTGKAQLLTDRFDRPNGLTFSPDESHLYVNDSQSGEVFVFDVNVDGSLSNGKLFATPEDPNADGSPDGMKVDTDGNLYTTGPGGIWIYSPEGEVIDRISTPESATNLSFGGADNRTLFITGPDSVFRIELNATGVQ
jgi:gluconolactonase